MLLSKHPRWPTCCASLASPVRLLWEFTPGQSVSVAASGCGPKTHTGLTLSLTSRVLPSQTRAEIWVSICLAGLSPHHDGTTALASAPPAAVAAFPSAPLSEQSLTVRPLASSSHSVDLAQMHRDRQACLPGRGKVVVHGLPQGPFLILAALEPHISRAWWIWSVSGSGCG